MPSLPHPNLDATKLHPDYYTNLVHRQNTTLRGDNGRIDDACESSSQNNASRVPKIVPMVARPGTAEDLSSL